MNNPTLPDKLEWQALHRAVMFALGAHITASIAMAVVLGQGLETNPNMEARLTFIAGNSHIWAGGWFLWNLAALSILNFFVAFARVHGRSTPVLSLCVVMTAAAIACDLSSESVEMGLIPAVARTATGNVASAQAHTAAVDLFVLVHRFVVLISGYVANGLYSLSTGIAAFSCRNHYSRPVSLAAAAVTIFGIAESYACMIDSAPGMLVAHAILMPCFLLWQVGIGFDARKQAKLAQIAVPNPHEAS